MNLNNFGIAKGRITRVSAFDNKNGSRSYYITVACQNDYLNDDGTRDAQFITFRRYIRPHEREGIYGLLETGDMVEIMYHQCNNDYVDDSGEEHYEMENRIDQIQYAETRAAKEERKRRRQIKNDDDIYYDSEEDFLPDD